MPRRSAGSTGEAFLAEAGETRTERRSMRRLLLVDVSLKYVGKFHTSILIEKKVGLCPTPQVGYILP